MNEQRQIEELAKIEGLIRPDEVGHVIPYSMDKDGWSIDGRTVKNSIPRYLTSHDAMQWVIDGLDDKTMALYAMNLWEITMSPWRYSYKATPEQKAEAVLKALGRWTTEGNDR